MRIKNHRMPDAKRRAADACVRTASSCVGQSPNPPNYRTREAHLQHPQEDRCNWSCDDNQDYPRTRLFDELTRQRQREPRARWLARDRLDVVLALSMSPPPSHRHPPPHPQQNGNSAQIAAAAWLGFAKPNPCRTTSPTTKSTTQPATNTDLSHSKGKASRRLQTSQSPDGRLRARRNTCR